MVYFFGVTDASTAKPPPPDKWIQKFLAHLATDRGASAYTQRNYQQALTEFARWHLDERKSAAGVGKTAAR